MPKNNNLNSRSMVQVVLHRNEGIYFSVAEIKKHIAEYFETHITEKTICLALLDMKSIYHPSYFTSVVVRQGEKKIPVNTYSINFKP